MGSGWRAQAVGVVTLVACLAAPWPAGAQPDTLDLRIQPAQVGLAGQVRAGVWTPLMLELNTRASGPRAVRCQWLVTDADGDAVYAQRSVTLTPGRTSRAWLYAVIPHSDGPGDSWQIRVVDEQDSRTLATHTVGPLSWLDRHETVVGITGAAALGLEPYVSGVTRHEGCRLLRSVVPSQLPDRWYGLSVMQALIWTPEGGDPGSPAIASETRHAIRQWVRRGGHLVVVLSDVGDYWFTSPLADLLPPVQPGELSASDPPAWLGSPVGEPLSSVNLRRLEPAGAAGRRVSVLLRDTASRPIVVARAYGFGRVTLVGINLADPRLVRAGVPNGPLFWSAVLGWRGPVYGQATVDRETQQRDMTGPALRQRVELDRFIPRMIAMRDTATPALLAAMIVFGLYWLWAGPLSFAVLKKCHQTRHSWLLFGVWVILFSVIAWGGAWSLRPGTTAIAHFTVLDVDSGSGLVRAHSWLSLFVPDHGRVAVATGPADHDDPPDNTLASPGASRGGAGFLDRQAYAIDAAQPDRATIPVRATAKQFQVSYVDRAERLGPRWGLPRSRLSDAGRFPGGTLVHALPGSLENVLIVYCPGGGKTPLVWRRRQPWPANQAMSLEPPESAEPLVEPFEDERKRVWKQEGYLGRLIAFKTGQRWARQDDGEPVLADSDMVQAIEMLSFYTALPLPDYRNTSFLNRAVNYDRHLGRPLDLTALTALRCVIVIGHIDQGPVPIPLTVNGAAVHARGWTVVRWIGWPDQGSSDPVSSR